MLGLEAQPPTVLVDNPALAGDCPIEEVTRVELDARLLAAKLICLRPFLSTQLWS